MHDKIIVSYSTIQPTKINLFMKLFGLSAANDHHVIMASIQKEGESLKVEEIRWFSIVNY